MNKGDKVIVTDRALGSHFGKEYYILSILHYLKIGPAYVLGVKQDQLIATLVALTGQIDIVQNTLNIQKMENSRVILQELRQLVGHRTNIEETWPIGDNKCIKVWMNPNLAEGYFKDITTEILSNIEDGLVKEIKWAYNINHCLIYLNKGVSIVNYRD